MINTENFYIPQETHPERIFVLSNISEPENKVIVDLGCNLNKTLKEAVGVDILPLSDIQASLDELPMFEDNSVDIIISRHSLEHMLDPIKTLKEWSRILKQEGKIIIVLPDHGKIDTMDYILSQGTHLHAYTMDSFRNLVEAIGDFIIQESSIVLRDWSFGMVLIKRSVN